MEANSRNVRHYLGIDFEVWDGASTWFWMVLDPHREAGAIGVASSETDAVREASRSIEEMHSVCLGVSISVGWEITLGNLQRYLNRIQQPAV